MLQEESKTLTHLPPCSALCMLFCKPSMLPVQPAQRQPSARQQRCTRRKPAAAGAAAAGAPPSPNTLLPAWPCAAAANCGGYWRADGSSPPPLLFNIEAAAWRAPGPHCACTATPQSACLQVMLLQLKQPGGDSCRRRLRMLPPRSTKRQRAPGAGNLHSQLSPAPQLSAQGQHNTLRRS